MYYEIGSYAEWSCKKNFVICFVWPVTSGALLTGVIERHALCVGNGAKECKGTITRKRTTRNRIEQSVIDIVLFSNDLRKHLVSMHVDEERRHVLTRITKTKKGQLKVKESDHNVVITEFDCKMKTYKKDVVEVYNLTNKDCQVVFKKYTSETNMLSTSINEEGDNDQVINKFIKKLNGCIAVNFKKVRINAGKSIKDDDLFTKMRKLKEKTDPASKEELNKVIEAIANEANNNFSKLKEELTKLKPLDGKIDSKQLWKLKKRLCPRLASAPSVMKDASGNLITSEKALKKRALEVYSKRLEGNTIATHLKELEDDVNTLCEVRVETSKQNKATEWSMEDLKEALKHIKKNK